ncbi:hypothetical protein TSUD_288430 [Trifolium subterraneum]|uniref:Uncharacterized protein n=1 Tax=Trifolium subterraneum TaxID=3900 RepID=A0A2Z6P3L3_TRISU|nr:hypothetical protein TSUD_288430 [Trifolium subterraneum]
MRSGGGRGTDVGKRCERRTKHSVRNHHRLGRSQTRHGKEQSRGRLQRSVSGGGRRHHVSNAARRREEVKEDQSGDRWLEGRLPSRSGHGYEQEKMALRDDHGNKQVKGVERRVLI